MAMTFADKGAFQSYQRLSRKWRKASQPYLPLKRFVTEEQVIGPKGGDTVNVTRKGNTNTLFPTTPLSETAPIPETDYTQSQVPITLKEWGQAMPLTEKMVRLEDYDAKDVTQQLLMDNMARWYNNLASNKLKQTGVKYSPITGTTATLYDWTADSSDVTFTMTEGESFGMNIDGGGDVPDPGRNIGEPDLWNLRNMAVDYLHMPPMSGTAGNYGEYAMVCNQTMISNLMRNSAIAAALNYAYSTNKDGSPFLRGFMGTYAGIQFYLDTQNFNGNINVAAGTASAYRGEAVFFGDDALVSAVALAPEIRTKAPQDYGRDQGIAWYSIMNLKFIGSTTSQADARGGFARAIYISGATAAPTEL